MKRIAVVALMSIFLMFLDSCFSPLATKVTATFDSQGGSVVASQSVILGSTISVPTEPIKSGALFGGWYQDSACTIAWDFVNDKATNTTTLYAKWNPVFVVTFDSQNGSAVASQIVSPGNTITAPADPTKAGFLFGGWYKDSTFTITWDFVNDKVTAAITIYANWMPTYVVTFDSQHGSNIASQTVSSNSIVSAPTAPTRSGYSFVGWYKDATLANLWDFANDKATGNITIFASWAKVSITLAGTGNKILDSVTIPSGIYRIAVSTTGYFQLFDIDRTSSIFNLSSGQGLGAETVFISTGKAYVFKTGNCSTDWTIGITTIDYLDASNIPSSIADSNGIQKVFGPFLVDLVNYKVTMTTDGYFQLFPINAVTGLQGSSIFNAFSGSSGSQNVYKPSNGYILLQTGNVSTPYSVTFQKM
jgi:uncharacterized repeat protein (TIGR02543 family)